ncbi:MAG: L,D-transpeptidase family protein [Rhodomicrobium sp.]
MQFPLYTIFVAALAFYVPFTSQTQARTMHGRSKPAVTRASVAAKASELSSQFEERGLKLGSPIFLRVYKKTSEMQLWVQQGPRYVLFKTYGICRWSGALGPKMFEGDRQSPEGLYRITSADLIVNPRWDRAMNINYPNSYDVLNGRSGSSILIHGKCGSIGCFAIQDTNVEEVYAAVRAALHNGQSYIPVLSLPFRFAAVAPAKEDTLQMNEFWTDLRRADLLFDRDKLPPSGWICDGRYYFADRRGDTHRHAVHLPGCKPLDKPVDGKDRETARLLHQQNEAMLAATPRMTPKESAEHDAKNCNAKSANCRLLRVALKSPVMCPKKYARCRTAKAAFTKSADCPLKYPRCRSFAGREPSGVRSTTGGRPALSHSLRHKQAIQFAPGSKQPSSRMS